MTAHLRFSAALVALAACAQPLEAGLEEEDANAILVALHDRGIGAQKEPEAGAETYAVRVAGDDLARGLDVLRAEGLPRRAPEGLREVFGEGGLVPTATEERARYVAALGGELARSLEAIDGVLEARVHLALPERRLLAVGDAKPRPRASVLLRHRGPDAPYDPADVRALVAGAVEDLDADDVAVVGVATAPPPEPTEGGLVNIGPVTVTRSTAGALKAVLAGSLALNVVFALLMGWALSRRRRQSPEDEAPPPAP